MRHVPFLIRCLVPFSLGATMLHAQTNAERNARVEAILPALQKAAARYRVATHSPGLAIVVATPDRTYFISSGRQRVSSPARVSEFTAFQVASVSKPITGTYAARLVTEGRLDWDDRIADLLPWFRFESESVTRQVTILDMLTQRSGLLFGTNNILEDLGYGQRTVLERMRFIDPSPRFRKKWAYANFGITLGGVAAARTTPWSFPASISRTLFRPLGMTGTTATYTHFRRKRNRAQMNYILDGRAQPIFERDAQAQAPAGGVSSTAHDLGVLLQMYLNDGVFEGKEFLSPSALKMATAPITYVNDFADGSAHYYGIGWDVKVPEKGPRTIFHTGAFAGVRTILSFRPEEKIGIAALSNSFIGLPPEAIEDAFYQLYETGRVKRDTLAKWRHTLPPSALATLDQVLKSSTKLDATVQGRPLDAFAGIYTNDYFGRFVIKQDADGLTLRVGPNEPPMRLRQNAADGKLYVLNRSGDYFVLEFENFAGGKFTALHVPAADDVGWGELPRLK